jgi:ribosomal protein S18 acetylase RimI-like enzyme
MHYIIQLEGVDAGMIQTYLLSSYPHMDKYVQAGKDAAMVDVFLAPAFMHKGHGSHIMKAFLRNFVFSRKLFIADKCAIGPELKNISAIRMYEKAGFCWIKTIQIPEEDEPEYIMII